MGMIYHVTLESKLIRPMSTDTPLDAYRFNPKMCCFLKRSINWFAIKPSNDF